MKTYTLRCWKYPAFSAEIEIEAESLERALEIGQEDGRFDYAAFEECADGDYGPPVFLRATDEDTGDERELDLEPGADLLAAAKAMLAWLTESKLTHTKPAGVGHFRTEPVEYSVVADLRAAIAKAEGGR